MAEPLVTIVTPTLNQGHFIRSTIESVLSQDYPNIEYIVMDGGSTDQTAAVVQDYSSRLTWISERDRGQSHAINKGFRMARGEIVAWLNSDDLLLPGAVQKAVGACQANQQAGAVYGEGYLIDRNGATTGRFPCTEAFNLWKLVHLSDYILQQTVFFKKRVLDEIGEIREDLHYVMDWDLLIRIGKRYPLHYIPEYLGCLREYPEAKSFSGGRARIREIAAVLRQHTGQRFAPGYINYGLDTYRRLWCEAIESRTPALLKRPSTVMQRWISIMCGLLIDRAIHHSQGWYSDKWASRRVKLMLPPVPGTLVLEGIMPDFGPAVPVQTITITVSGVFAKQVTFGPGPFRIEVALQPHTQEPIKVELLAKKFVMAAGTDRRKLCYLLNDVGVEPEELGTSLNMSHVIHSTV
ncbi:MAG: glycosyltransferase [Acidobacteriota bacterium]|nr:glycosyltransferase [Acidobacteriota bacterium]